MPPPYTVPDRYTDTTRQTVGDMSGRHGVLFGELFGPAAAQNWAVGSIPGRVGCSSRRLYLYIALNCSKVWSVQYFLWYCAL